MVINISTDDNTEKKYTIKRKMFDEVHEAFMKHCPLLADVAKNSGISSGEYQRSPYACSASYNLASEANRAIYDAREAGAAQETVSQMVGAVDSCVSSRFSGESCQKVVNKILIFYNVKRRGMEEKQGIEMLPFGC